MTTFRRLVEFEYSRFRIGLPSLSGKGLRLTLYYLVAMLGAGAYLFKQVEAPRMIFSSGLIVSFGITLALSVFHMMSFWAQSQREWWLTLPYSRMKLAGSKAVGLMLVGLSSSGLVQLTCLGNYMIAAGRGAMPWLSVQELAGMIGASLILSGALIPVAVMMGLAISTMYNGWARWLLIPYVIVMQSPFILLNLNMTLESSELWIISPARILLYAAGVIVVGWPVSYMLLKLVSRIGLANMADMRHRMKSFASSRVDKEAGPHWKSNTQHDKGWTVLYKLERDFFQHYASIKWVQIVGYTFLVIIAIAAFFSSASTAIVEMMQAIFIIPTMAGSIWMINKVNVDRKSWQWKLSFPRPRIQLIAAQVAAVWVTIMRINVTIAAASGIGIAAGIATGKADLNELSVYWPWIIFSFVLYASILTVAIGLSQIAYYLMKSRVLVLLLIPLYLLICFQSMLVQKFIFPEDIVYASVAAGEQSPDWAVVALLLVIGVPVALLSIWLGSKHMHLAIHSNTRASGKE